MCTDKRMAKWFCNFCSANQRWIRLKKANHNSFNTKIRVTDMIKKLFHLLSKNGHRFSVSRLLVNTRKCLSLLTPFELIRMNRHGLHLFDVCVWSRGVCERRSATGHNYRLYQLSNSNMNQRISHLGPRHIHHDPFEPAAFASQVACKQNRITSKLETDSKSNAVFLLANLYLSTITEIVLKLGQKLASSLSWTHGNVTDCPAVTGG